VIYRDSPLSDYRSLGLQSPYVIDISQERDVVWFAFSWEDPRWSNIHKGTKINF